MATVSAFAGTSSRVKSVAITPVLTTDQPTYTGSPATLAETTDWAIGYTLRGKTTFLGQESDANAEGVLHDQQLRGGTANWTVRVEAAETAVTGVLAIGSFYYLDLILQKGAATGRKNCPVKLVGINPSTGVGKPYATTTLEFDGNGVLPAVS